MYADAIGMYSTVFYFVPSCKCDNTVVNVLKIVRALLSLIMFYPSSVYIYICNLVLSISI